MSLEARFQQRITAASRAVAALAAQTPAICGAAGEILRCLRSGGTVATCGNGGSAAEALHLAEELIGCYRDRGRPPQRAVCLNADPTALTCIANDYGFDDVFARQVRGLLGPGDVLVALSTSGNSPNVLRALETARELEVITIGLLGKGGGRARALCDHAIVPEGDDTGTIQECHLVLVHLLCEALEGDAPSGA